MLHFSRAAGQSNPIVLADRARDAQQWDAAVRHYRTALARNPHNPQIWVQYGHALKEGGSYAAAEAAYRRAIADDPRVADTYLQLGHLLKLQGRTEEAKAAYLRAISIDRSLHEAAGELAVLGCSAEDFPDLLRAIPAPVAADPTNGLAAGPRRQRGRESVITRADRARDLGQWEIAGSLYRRALDRNPGNPPIWVQYGHVLKQSGQLRDAEQAYRQALAYDGRLTDAHLELGRLLKLRGETEAAQQAFLQAFALDPSLDHPLAELVGLGWPDVRLAELTGLAEADAPDRPCRERSEDGTSKAEGAAVDFGKRYGFADNEAAARLATAGPPPLFSVLIPVHDRTSAFREALDSVLSQSFADFEIIIVTNASPPETLAIIEEYKQRDRRVRAFYYSDNSGNACRGRNRGIIEARGEFISLLDSDDLYLPDTLEKVRQIFREQQVDFVCGRAYFIVDGTRSVGDFVTGRTTEAAQIDVSRFIRGENTIQTCTVHIRRDLLLKCGGFRPEQEYLEDLELWLRLARHGCRFYCSDELFSKYRFHEGNTELKYIGQRNYWLEHMRNNYLRPFEDWGIGPAADRAAVETEANQEAVPVWPGRVDAEWYLRQYPDIARGGADPLDHFINYGRREGRKPNAAEARADGWITVTDVEISCLKRPVLREEVALFATHSPHGRLKPHVRHYLDCLRRQGVAVILIIATEKPFTAADADLMSGVDGIFVRQAKGYDFAAWAHALRLHPELTNSNILYLLNDSVFGPTNDAALGGLLDRIRDSNADFIGLTESFEQNWHLQSYFLALKSRALTSVAFREFVDAVVCFREKEDVITLYELRFAQIMKIAGLNCEAMFRKTDVRNPTIFHWRHLLESGFPFLKLAAVRDASDGVDAADWREVLAAQGYDVSLAERTLDEGSATERMLQEEIPASPVGSSSVQRDPAPAIDRSGTARQPGAAHRQTSALQILIFSHELTESGAPRAAFDVARILRDAGHFVAVAAPHDGPYRERLRNIGVDVIVDQSLFNQGRDVVDLARNFDKVICNTIVCWPVVAQLRDVIPVYWYVHESELIHLWVRDTPGFLSALRSGATFLVPSGLSANALAVHGLKARLIECGTDDRAGDVGKVVIGLFGSYEPRKGQDLAVKGMLCVPQELRVRAELRLFGRTLDPGLRHEIEEIAGGDRSIVFFGEVDHDECIRQMAASDIILVPSRDDPLPFVTLDALSLGKTLVCSNRTGTSAYLEEGRSGLILHENTPEEIGRALARLIGDPQLRKMLGTGAHQVYEQNFTVPLFTAKLLTSLDMDKIS